MDRVNRAISGAPLPLPQTPERRASQRGIDLIHSFETLKLTSYKDPGSKNGLPITNGWGTTVDENGKPIPLGAVWTKEKADRLFARDLTKFENAVTKLVGTAPTTQGQFDALVSFAYNIGEGDGGLKTSTLLRKHLSGDYAGAKAEFVPVSRVAVAMLIARNGPHASKPVGAGRAIALDDRVDRAVFRLHVQNAKQHGLIAIVASAADDDPGAHHAPPSIVGAKANLFRKGALKVAENGNQNGA